MTWLWEKRDSNALQFAYWADSSWWDVKTLKTGRNWFVNWADFPGIFAHSNGSLITYTLEKNNPDTYAYDISLSVSWDQGNSWLNGTVPHKDQTETEHGFVSFFEYDENKTGMIWLDGRNYILEDPNLKNMTVRFATIDRLGHIANEQELDAKVCSCCQTDAARTKSGAVVVYRDRSDEEIRDISYLLLEDGQWSEPKALSNDQWEIAACPVNGPAVDAAEEKIAAVWYTAPMGNAQVKWAFSIDGGHSFSEAILVDDQNPKGRVDLKIVGGEIWISWIATQNNDGLVKLNRYDWNADLIESHIIGAIDVNRDSGFPRMAYAANNLLIAWTNQKPKEESLILYRLTF